MKAKALLFFILLQTLIYAEPHTPLVVVSIMIKNEAHSIEDTLEPLIKGGIDAFLVFDTGSTDNTLECVDRLFKKYPDVQAVVKQEPFVDFSTSRNRALDLAKEAYPEAEFILMPDAEWILHNVEGLLEFCRKEVNTKTPCYLVRVLGSSLDYHSTRLTRAKGPCRYVGKVHEVIMPNTPIKVPSDVYLEQCHYQEGYKNSQARWHRDRVLLEQSVEEDPNDSRALFYLAQTCQCLNDVESAYRYYKRRTEVKSWPEEDFMSLYRLAQVTETLAANDPSKLAEAIYWYLEAYQFRPTRAEPLVQLSLLYLKQGKHALSFLFAKKAYEIEYPAEDILFVDKYLYDFVRYDILGQCAWYINEKKIGHEALKRAIEYNPNADYLQRNLTFYVDK